MSSFFEDFIEGFTGVFVVIGFCDTVVNMVKEGLKYTPFILPTGAWLYYYIPTYLQDDLAGGVSNENKLAINDMANWYNTHKYTGAMGEKFDWAEKPFKWSDYSILPNGIPAKSWYELHDGEDNLRTAFELAEKINPNKYEKPVLTDDLFQAYKRYAKELLKNKV